MAFWGRSAPDVGQGDGAVLISPLGQVVLFDNGGFFYLQRCKNDDLRL
jgi:hypothetical protein